MTFRQFDQSLWGRSHQWFSCLCIVGAMSLVAGSPLRAAQPDLLIAMGTDEPLCYMRTSDGRTINLSRFCGKGNASSAPLFSARDQKFLEQYQIFLRRRLGSSPTVQTALNQAATFPQAVIQRAQGVCAALQGDTPQSTPDQQNSGDTDLMDSMAVKYYCPHLDN